MKDEEDVPDCPFKAADRVQHKSGGPTMIVVTAVFGPSTDTKRGWWIIGTRWFDRDTRLPVNENFFAFELSAVSDPTE